MMSVSTEVYFRRIGMFMIQFSKLKIFVVLQVKG
jgi:hypothetical protein